MSAYYNENDPFAVAWLRELIARGVIADGEVDARSIKEVTAADLRGFTQCHFFAGIGVWAYALAQAGWPEDVECWTGSCPCQPFSVSGNRKGASDERHLWPRWFEIVRESRPLRIFGEQVASDDGLAWLDVVSADLENADYTIGAVDTCAAGFGAPQISQRLFFVAEADGGHSIAARLQRGGINGQFTQNGGAADRLAKAIGTGSPPEHIDGKSRSTEIDSVGARSSIGDVAKTEETGRTGRQDRIGDHGDARGWARSAKSSRNGEIGRMESPARGRFGIDGCAPGNPGHAALANATDGVGTSIGAGLERHSGDVRNGSEPGRDGTDAAGSIAEAGATGGFWRDAEWLWCRDGKYRPVEPGTFPLAHGAARRVGRLRGYGNALVAPQAIGFVRAYLEEKTAVKNN